MSIDHDCTRLLAILFVCAAPLICVDVVAQDQSSPAVAMETDAQNAAAQQVPKGTPEGDAAVAKAAGDEGHDVNSEDASEAVAMRLQLELLQVRRKRLSLNYGDAHPTILRLDDEIKSLAQELKAAAAPQDLLQRADPKSLKSMNEDELRKLVGELVKRVLVLEKEVHTLKESPTISRRFPQ